jgi:hypothetical protein
MLHRLEIENFYSIRDPQIIDLRVAGNAPDEPGRFAPSWPGAVERVPKVVALFGANASGKSNVLKALSFLAWLINEGFRLDPDVRMPYERFYGDAAQDLPTRLAVFFAGPLLPDRANFSSGAGPVEGDVPLCRYVYEITIGGSSGEPQKILSESLQYWPPDAGRKVRLFERDREGTVSRREKFCLFSNYYQVLMREIKSNRSVVSILNESNHPISKFVSQAIAGFEFNIFDQKMSTSNDHMARYYARYPEYLNLLNQDIDRIGLGVREMRLEHGINGPIALFEHEGLIEPLPARLESYGTLQFVKIFPLIAKALETGNLAIVDELDIAIHPLILPEIIRWFHDSVRNPRNAQLWMTCQNASLLEDLVKEEVLFCEKDSRGRTSVYSLADVQMVRRNDNYYKKYLGGVYGAVPHLG